MTPSRIHRILVVEDDAGIRDMLASALGHAGFQFVEVGRGDLALELLRRDRFDAVLLDLMVPVVNGFEILRFLAAERKGMLSRVVVMTAASDRTLAHFDGAPVGALFRKPFDVVALLDCLRTITASPAGPDLVELPGELAPPGEQPLPE